MRGSVQIAGYCTTTFMTHADAASLNPSMTETRARALKIRALKDVNIPPLRYWNDTAGSLKRHQRVGLAWLYMVQKGLLADAVGLGKTIHAISLLAMLKERRELTNRAIIVMRPAALLQWRDEFNRFSPSLNVEVGVGARRERIEKYSMNWDVMLIGYQMFLTDIDYMLRLEPGTLVIDDVDPLRNYENRTAMAIARLARDTERTIVMSGTPLQTRLHELYDLLIPLGGYEVFGSRTAFERRYVRTEPVTIYDYRSSRKITTKKVIGYKNVDEFKRLVAPFYLRRTDADLDASDLPAVISENVWLDMYPVQRRAYGELQKSVLRLIDDEGKENIKHVSAFSKLAAGAQICAGMATLGHADGPEQSCKFDWIEDKLTGDFYDDKTVIFCQYKSTIRALCSRFDRLHIGYVTIWGDEPNPEVRRSRQLSFWNDSRTRVCIGTSAMEQSLNLQISNKLINVDMLLNPRRMEQLLGRIRRLGSGHEHVYVFNLLTRDTQEERYLPILQSRQAIGDYVFGEVSELFEQISPLQLLQLIRP